MDPYGVTLSKLASPIDPMHASVSKPHHPDSGPTPLVQRKPIFKSTVIGQRFSPRSKGGMQSFWPSSALALSFRGEPPLEPRSNFRQYATVSLRDSIVLCLKTPSWGSPTGILENGPPTFVVRTTSPEGGLPAPVPPGFVCEFQRNLEPHPPNEDRASKSSGSLSG
jgi:hypothetical protein